MMDEQLKSIAYQLSHPRGEDGIRTAEMMHISNIGMTRNTIKSLKITSNDKVLELGHGNGNHIPELLNEQEAITYYGLEISELMNKEATFFNSRENASFLLYDGKNIPYESNYFNGIMTVNTLYFWKKPTHLLNEIYRVLKPAGKFSCAFAEKDFMEKLPFTQFIFNLYDRVKVEKLIQSTPFKKTVFQEHIEHLTGKDGQSIERNYTIAILEK